MPELFRNAGYRTGMFGKWHLGDNYPFRPQDRGFDESLWFPSSHINSLPDYWENDYFDDVYCRNGERERYEGYCTEVFFTQAMAWIEERGNADEPFFLYLPTNAPHAPLWVPPGDRKALEAHFAANEHLLSDLVPHLRDNVIRFLAMIYNLDRQIGRLRSFLAEKGLSENTLFVFMTDNGSTFGPSYYNAGMRGAKQSLWEGGHRVPCFFHWPAAGLSTPREVRGLTEVQDLLPTFAELCGFEPPDDRDGISLAPVITGDLEPPDDRMLVVNYSRMPGDLDYPTPDSPAVVRREESAVLWRRWRLLEETQLYDVDSDPGQTNNVIDDHPDIAKKMRDHLSRWWSRVETSANEHQRVVIGSDRENPAMLSACEWADVFVDQQRQVRLAARRNSYWYLEVAEAGTYTFVLRRWPKESGLALSDGCEETTVTDGRLEPGVALPIARARLFIQGMKFRNKVSPGDAEAVFTVELSAGPAMLHTWFDDERGEPLCGAYYVYVTREPRETA
jgi:arylsulfatase